MKELGVTIYPTKDFDLTSNKEYIDLASMHGITRVFATTFCLEPEELKTPLYIEKFKILANYIKEKQMSLQIDLFPEVFDAFGATPENVDPLFDIGVNELRIDAGFTMHQIAKMSKNKRCSKIVINASEAYREVRPNVFRPVDIEKYLEADIKEFLDAGGDITKLEASHNMYPHCDSGISFENAILKRAVFKKFNIKVTAFIPAQTYQCTLFNMNCSSPTIEDQRHLMSFEAAREIFFLDIADAVFIADGYVSKEELQYLEVTKEYENTVQLRIKIKGNLSKEARKLVFDTLHFNRGASQYLIRSTENRGVLIPKDTIEEREKYSVYIDNETCQRYCGELSITLKAFPKDERFNLVGVIHPNDQRIVDNFKTGQDFTFIEYE